MNRRFFVPPSLLAVAVLAVLVLVPASAAAAKPCSSSGLVIWAGEEPGGGAAGSVYYRIDFTNLSGATCTLGGAPRVSAVDLRGGRIGASARAEPGTKVRPVTLAPGDTASASLRIVDALNFPKPMCKPTLAAGLRITVPGGSGAKVAPLAFETCARSSSKTLSVAAVVAAH